MESALDWPAQPLAKRLVPHVLQATREICAQMESPQAVQDQAVERRLADRSLSLGWALGAAAAALGHDLLFERRNRHGLESMHTLVGELVPLAPATLPQLQGAWGRWEFCWILSSLWYLAAPDAANELRFSMESLAMHPSPGDPEPGYNLHFAVKCESHSRLWIERLQRQCPEIQFATGSAEFQLQIPKPPVLFRRGLGPKPAGASHTP